ncbi:MAG: preprotein translocase subunit SecE [Deltaproteobacteria bacterium]
MQPDSRAPVTLQLGVQKYLYTGYFVGGFIVAYLVHQVASRALGEGHDAIATVIGALAGITAVYATWKNKRIRTLSQEVLDELVAVSWPSRQETYTATVVVILTSVVSSALIFFLDRFWSWFTDMIFR